MCLSVDTSVLLSVCLFDQVCVCVCVCMCAHVHVRAQNCLYGCNFVLYKYIFKNIYFIIIQWLNALFVDFKIVSAESGTDRLL